MAVKTVQANISSKLSAEEWDVIEAFRERAERLRTTELVARGTYISGSVNITTAGLSAKTELPAEPVIEQFVMAMRHFTLQNDLPYIHRVLNTLGKHMPGEAERAALKWFRQRWNAALLDGAVQIKVNGEAVTPARLFDLWCNAHYFHSDANKAKALAELWDTLSAPLAKYFLLDALYNWTRLVLRLDEGMKGLRRP
jgi:hypothetical protein